MPDCPEARTEHADKSEVAVMKHQFGDIERRLAALEESLKNIKENHLVHINEELVKIRVNQKWILTLGSTIGGLISGGVMLLVQKLF